MGKETGTSWTDSTWNPIRGCSRVSEGCRNCYAEKVAHRFSGPGLAYEGLTSIVNGRPVWNGTIEFAANHLLDPLKWKEPRRIFVNSMSDLFHENVTDEMRDKIFAVMALCPQHTFQVPTKRPERLKEYLSQVEARVRVVVEIERMAAKWGHFLKDELIEAAHALVARWPLPNVHLGVSVENQKAADARLDYLCELASIGWQTMVSFEPLLSAVDPGPWWLSLGMRTWAIVGGE